MTIELQRDGTVRRATGDLEYLTSATLIPRRGGWRLEEKLLSQNGLLSCRGEPGSVVVTHLDEPVLLSVRDGALHYQATGRQVFGLRFSRVAEKPEASQ